MTDDLADRLKRGHVRHFGASLLPLTVTTCDPRKTLCLGVAMGRTFYRVADHESGAVTDWVETKGRLRCIGNRPA